jgi:hypothetical protein
MICSWPSICSTRVSWKMTLRSWTYSTFSARRVQWQMTCQSRPPPQLWFLMECWKDGCGNLQLGQPTQAKGGKTSTSKLAVPTVLVPWSSPRVVGITEDSVHPSVQDPETQVGPDTWITEIRTYMKDNILPDDMASAGRIARLAKRYTLVEGDLYRRGANGVLM